MLSIFKKKTEVNQKTARLAKIEKLYDKRVYKLYKNIDVF
jgi:hypothetical protein